jgi:MFS family permease
MTNSRRLPPPSDKDETPWRRNLAVCVFGSFTTVFAMTLLLPFLPLYVAEMGVHGHAAIVQWSGIVFGATFLAAGLTAPLWGRLGDRYGRKSMLVRASIGMAVTMSLMGLTTNIWQLVALRLLAGLSGGYASGSTILVATQTPTARSGWALGLLSSGIMAGNLLGPLVGGLLPHLIGIRATFFGAGGLIFVAFLASAFLLREPPRLVRPASARSKTFGYKIFGDKVVLAMLATGFLLMVANMSIEPIITVYIATLIDDPNRLTFMAGMVMSAAALGSVISASKLGKLADRIGHTTVIILALLAVGVLLLPQAFVTSAWQLVVLRFMMGLALGGLVPCIAAVIRHDVPDHSAGTALGFSLSAQFAGQVVGPLIGGFIGGQIGMRWVFYGTCVLMLMGAAFNWLVRGQNRQSRPNPQPSWK